MGHRRDLVRMSSDEVTAFLGSQRRLQVATLNADGSPHLSVVWHAMHGGDVCFVTYSRTQKIRNLLRDPRITVSVDDGERYEDLRGVVLSARAWLFDGHAALPYLKTILRRRELATGEAELDASALSLGLKRTVVVVHPERVYSWDHAKLGGLY